MQIKTKDYIFIGLLIVGLLLFGYQKIFRPDSIGNNDTKMIKIGSARVLVDVVDTPEKMEKGLGEREEMPMEQGMLFVHKTPGRYSYTMNGMMFNLDFIFIKDDIVVDIAKNVSTKYQGTIEGGSDYNYVLEMNADWTRLSKVQSGTKVEIK